MSASVPYGTMKYAHRLIQGIALIAVLALTGCLSPQPEAEPDVPDIDTPAAPVEDEQHTAVFHTSSSDILVTWDDALFTKDIPEDAMQLLEEFEYPGNSERYLMYTTPTGNYFVDYYPSFNALKESLTWQEDASEDRTQVAGGCTVVPTEPPLQGATAYKELCYYNPGNISLSGAYNEIASFVTYTHCLIPVGMPTGEQGVLYFWGLDDDGYDECSFLTGLSQKHFSIEVQEQTQ